MKDVGHEDLEAHVLDTGDVLRPTEVVGRVVATTLAGIVDEVLGNLTESATFLADCHRWKAERVSDERTGKEAKIGERTVNDHSHAAPLRTPDRLLDTVNQVRPARADVGTKDVGAVTLVVDAEGELLGRVAHEVGVTEDVDGETTDGREEDLEVVASEELGVHSA